MYIGLLAGMMGLGLWAWVKGRAMGIMMMSKLKPSFGSIVMLCPSSWIAREISTIGSKMRRLRGTRKKRNSWLIGYKE